MLNSQPTSTDLGPILDQLLLAKQMLEQSHSNISELERLLPMELSRNRERGIAQNLSPRQYDIVRLTAEGHTNKEIGVLLGINEDTANYHKLQAAKHIGLASPHDALIARFAIRAGMVTL